MLESQTVCTTLLYTMLPIRGKNITEICDYHKNAVENVLILKTLVNGCLSKRSFLCRNVQGSRKMSDNLSLIKFDRYGKTFQKIF